MSFRLFRFLIGVKRRDIIPCRGALFARNDLSRILTELNFTTLCNNFISHKSKIQIE